jgi:signal transduction histidine kinase
MPASSSEMLGLIAHELRQPLSTIESIAYYLTLVLPRDDEKVHEHLLRLQQLVEQSNWILSCGMHLADPETCAPEPVDLEELITQTVAMRAQPSDNRTRLDLACGLPPVKLDPGLARKLIENLITMFRMLASESHPAVVKTSSSGAGALLEISTEAPGYRSEAALGPGSGLGLACARGIVAAHGGSIDVMVNAAAGIRVRVMLP